MQMTELGNTAKVRAKSLTGAFVLLAAVTQIACDGGGNFVGSSDVGTEIVLNDGSSSPNEPSADSNILPESGNLVLAENFAYTGTFVMDEYSPGLSPEYEGVIEITPSPLVKFRILNGNKPRAYPDGRITYNQNCGQRINRVALAEPNRISTPITPCSSEVPNTGASPTRFGFSNLSPDGTKLAVEAIAFIDGDYTTTTLVYEVSSQTELSTWAGGYAPTWTPDGRLLMASNEGLYLLDATLDNPSRLGEIAEPVNNPDVSPDGTTIAFEFNQQIWAMNIDGTEPREILVEAYRLRYPTWAPDGSPSLAFLAVPSDDKYLRFIFVADFQLRQISALSLDPVLEFTGANYLRTVNGPLSWNP